MAKLTVDAYKIIIEALENQKKREIERVSMPIDMVIEEVETIGTY